MLLADLIPQIPDRLLALFVAMAAIIFSIRRWRLNTVRKNRTKDTPPMRTFPTTTPNSLSVREVTTEIHAMLADIEETARRAAAQIDNRATKLEHLIAEADQKIRHLESLLQQQSLTPPPPRTEENTRTAAQTLSQLRQERGAPAPTQDPAYSPIYTLADQGKSPREIAQELNRQPGEIELILALRSR